MRTQISSPSLSKTEDVLESMAKLVVDSLQVVGGFHVLTFMCCVW